MNMYDREKKLISKIRSILRVDVDSAYFDKRDWDRDKARLMEAGADHHVLIGTSPTGYTILILRKGWIVETNIDMIFFLGMRSKIYYYRPISSRVSNPIQVMPYMAFLYMDNILDEMGFNIIIKRGHCKLINKLKED